MSFNTYGQKSATSKPRIQVWAEVDGRKTGGGTLDMTNLKAGDVIPAGTPVALSKSGGTLTPIHFYELAVDLNSTDTEAILIGNIPLPETGNVIAVPAAIGGTGTGVAYSAITDNGNGTYTVTIEANALGAAKAGAVYAEADKAGTGAKVKNAAIPDGLLWHDIVIEEGDTLATGAVVDDGRIYEDRIVGIPTAYKALMPNIKFEKGV